MFMVETKRGSVLVLGFLLGFVFAVGVESQCRDSCRALASYVVPNGTFLSFIAQYFSTTIDTITRLNRISDPDFIRAGQRLNVPFSCGCVEGGFLGHRFEYDVQRSDTYTTIAQIRYSNLTTVEMLTRFNTYRPESIPDNGKVNVTVNCSCGNSIVSMDYGLFITYPLLPGTSLSRLSNDFNLSENLLADFNPGVDFSRGSGVVFIPGKDENGTYPPLQISRTTAGMPGGVIAGITVGVVAAALIVTGGSYFGFCRKKKPVEAPLIPEASEVYALQHIQMHTGSSGTLEKPSESGSPLAASLPAPRGITVNKSVEFSYEELAKATDEFSMANKIGQGGFGSVYYAELRGEKAAIKKMDMQATKEFLAELKVLTHVHHLNLVRLIGYCVESSLFLVYEYIDNGNLSQHLRGAGRNPLPWSTRVQIALDSARGLEYIHEHTVPVYIHRDIKSANILINKNFRAKVADFGLTKLTEVGSGSLQTRLVGTFGYMPPEYAQYGDVSPKIDVYAFGVVLYELISAKEAIVKTNEVVTESKGLVALFEGVLDQPDPRDDLSKLVDPGLGDNYPLDSVNKMAQLAKACTHENPLLRPSMRSIVVALMTLSSATEDWDIGTFYQSQGIVNLMSGR